MTNTTHIQTLKQIASAGEENHRQRVAYVLLDQIRRYQYASESIVSLGETISRDAERVQDSYTYCTNPIVNTSNDLTAKLTERHEIVHSIKMLCWTFEIDATELFAEI